MLSPGKFHLSVPKDPAANLVYRRHLLARARDDRGLQRGLLEACKLDIVFFTSSFVFQYNPKQTTGPGRVGPFVLWPFQVRGFLDRPPRQPGILWCYERMKTAVVEKSRDMGASWMFLIFQVWLCLFHEDVQALNISHNAKAVDGPSRNALFNKLRFILSHLPDWMRGEIDDVKFNLTFGRTSSEIAGEASTGKSGTGGRGSVVFVDEFSEIVEDVKVRENTANITDCRFFNGTHLDTGTEFFNLTKTPEIPRLVFHWTRHPKKNAGLYSWDSASNRPRFWRYDEAADEIVELDAPAHEYPPDFDFDTTGKPTGGPHPGIRSPWYDEKCVDIGTARGVCMGLDIDPSGAASQFYEPMLIRRLIGRAEEPYWQGDLGYTADGLATELVPRADGPLKFWFHPGRDGAGKLLRLPRSLYTLGADLGWGQGATPSCLCLFDAVKGAKVGQYTHAGMKPEEFARLTVALCRLLQTEAGDLPMLSWEVPGPGIPFGTEAYHALGYRAVYFHTDEYKDDGVPSDSPGWVANPQSKVTLHTEYQKALAAGLFVNPSAESLRECLAFVHTGGPNGSVEHPKAKSKRGDDPSQTGVGHGDLVVGDMQAWMLAKKLGLGGGRPRQVAPPPPDVYSIAGRRLYLARQREREEAWA